MTNDQNYKQDNYRALHRIIEIFWNLRFVFCDFPIKKAIDKLCYLVLEIWDFLKKLKAA
jgi:hypothetical protein